MPLEKDRAGPSLRSKDERLCRSPTRNDLNRRCLASSKSCTHAHTTKPNHPAAPSRVPIMEIPPNPLPHETPLRRRLTTAPRSVRLVHQCKSSLLRLPQSQVRPIHCVHSYPKGTYLTVWTNISLPRDNIHTLLRSRVASALDLA